MRKRRDNVVYLKHIRDAVKKISQYVSEHSPNEFKENPWDQDAVVRNLEIIGEAANNLDSDFRSNYNQIPWRAIIDFRNIAVHDYADLDLEVVWQILDVDLPELQEQIKQILNSFSNDS